MILCAWCGRDIDLPASELEEGVCPECNQAIDEIDANKQERADGAGKKDGQGSLGVCARGDDGAWD